MTPPPKALKEWINLLLMTAVKIAVVICVVELALHDPQQLLAHIQL